MSDSADAEEADEDCGEGEEDTAEAVAEDATRAGAFRGDDGFDDAFAPSPARGC